MNDRQRDIIEAAVERLMPNVVGLEREEVSLLLYQLAIDVMKPPALTVPAVFRRAPGSGEVLPRHQRATWAREKTVHDAE